MAKPMGGFAKNLPLGKAMTVTIPRSLPAGARLVCADNSGAKEIEILSVKGSHGVRRRYPAAGIGDMVVLYDPASKEELVYTIVHPREVDPTKGKISGVSPIGKAIIGRGEGEIVEVVVPAGTMRYQIKKVECLG